MADNQVIKVDRNLLTRQQRDEFDAWMDLFNHPGYKMLLERYVPHVNRIQIQFESAVGEQHLGSLQGALKTLRNLFSMPEQIQMEFLAVTGQLEQTQGQVTDDPVQPTDWQA